MVSVTAEPVRELATDHGPWWINADTVWDGSAAVDNIGTYGEGVVIGVIDSGINTDNQLFAEVGPVTGHTHINPPGRR